MNQKAFDILIIPGGWGGRIHFSPLVRRLHSTETTSRVQLRTDKPVKSRLVLTHSVGCLEPWEDLQPDTLLILGPPIFHGPKVAGSQIRQMIIAARKQEFDYQRRNHLLLAGFKIALKGLIKSIRDPGLMRHQFELLLHNNFVDKLNTYLRSHPHANATIIQYKGDVWEHVDLKHELSNNKQVKLITLDRSHDDVLYRPDYYAKLIEEMIA